MADYTWKFLDDEEAAEKIAALPLPGPMEGRDLAAGVSNIFEVLTDGTLLSREGNRLPLGAGENVRVLEEDTGEEWVYFSGTLHVQLPGGSTRLTIKEGVPLAVLPKDFWESVEKR